MCIKICFYKKIPPFEYIPLEHIVFFDWLDYSWSTGRICGIRIIKILVLIQKGDKYFTLVKMQFPTKSMTNEKTTQKIVDYTFSRNDLFIYYIIKVGGMGG